MIKSAYLTFVFLVLSRFFVYAQDRVPSWGGGNDTRDLSFGFVFQNINSDFKIIKNPNWRAPFYDADLGRNATDSLRSMSSNSSPGFAVGFITRYNLTEHLELRTTPTLVFSDKSVQYNYATEAQNANRPVSTTSVDIPLDIKIKSDRLGDFRFYLIGGVKYSMAISKKPVVKDFAPVDRPLQIMRNFGSYEAGIGCDIYFEYFKFSPEIKISNSFADVLYHENTPYSNPISKLFLHAISFSIYFE
ncbi:type IX secretion/gliding motility protein PorT/SprT [Mucilaginibacter ginkgonis]|uniref:Outer membrane beta-barrel protein n=1 Tax=Mucilaginibacter ginkgonis TaxID=2682091 RepID=A0A6I4IP38_9SPHI|nr:outer membrane beta-barrel protein [Mucilaginibacter ginkgonis]QQL48486.1 outer membrane beta-barrel protein [Mucilaginibacter ginkgonis]